MIHYDKTKFLKFQISHETGQLLVFLAYICLIYNKYCSLLYKLSQLITIFSFQWKFKYVHKYPNKVVSNKHEIADKFFYSAMSNKSQQ